MPVFQREPSSNIQNFRMEIVRRVNDNSRRTRLLEQRLEILDSRLRGLEEKVIDEMNTLKKGFDQILVDVRDVSKNLKELRSEILKINKNLEKTARKTEVRELESLLELYSPIKSKFITREDVERIIDKRIVR